jgi:hypothetical protein
MTYTEKAKFAERALREVREYESPLALVPLPGASKSVAFHDVSGTIRCDLYSGFQ